MRTLFNLTRAPDAGRGDIDALLVLRGRAVPTELQNQEVDFELKSATGGKPDISTVRDMGLHHIEKWRKLHWLFGVYGRDAKGQQELQFCLYGSPAKMKDWFDQKTEDVIFDTALAGTVPALITDDTLTSVVGPQESFTVRDARLLMKRQYTAAHYATLPDQPDGTLSREAMLAVLRARCEYVLRRGATLNNPHIPPSYFDGWERITEDHSARLRELVVDAVLASP